MPATTSGVTLTDVLPAGVTFVSATPSSGTCSGTSTVVCKLGIFPSGATATIDIVVTVASNAPDTLTNSASVTALTSDPVLGNNTATEVTTVSSLALTSAVSRKTHPSAGTFDIDLLPPAAGIECRSGGAGGNHQVVITFSAPVTVTDATVTPGPGGTASLILAPSANHNEVIASLSNVSNAQTITITLLGVSDGNTTANVSIPMGILLGDVTASGRVKGGEVFLFTPQILPPQNLPTFREDVNVSGRIDGTDVSIARQQNFTFLPP